MLSPAVDRPAAGAPDAPALSVVVVHYNTHELTRACIASVRREARELPTEIFLVDNGSTDGSGLRLAGEHPELHFLRFEQGLGFGAANNRAAARARGRFVLFLNSDTEIQHDALRRMTAFLEARPAAVLAGCRLLKADGRLDRACRRSFPTPLVSLWKLLGLNALFPNSRRFAAYDLRWRPEDGVYQVDSLVGAFMLGRREALPAGPFDEDFFFYGEDIDLCYRARQAGGEVWYAGDVVCLHRKGGTTNQRAPWVIYHFHHSMRVFYDKHYRARYGQPTTALVHGAILLRLGLMQLANRLKRRRR